MVEYRKGDVKHNIKAAVFNLREAYWSDEPTKIAKQFTDAEEVIISAICIGGYTLCKEDKE